MILINEFSEIWDKYNPSKDEHGKVILSTLIDLKKESRKQYKRSYYLLLVLGVFFYFLDINVANELDILSLKITNFFIIKWSILPVFSFNLYQGITSLIQENYYRQAIEDCWRIYVPELTYKDLSSFLAGNSFYDFEIGLLMKFNNKVAGFFLMVILFFVLIIPFIILFYMIYINIYEWCSLENLFFKVLVSVFTIVLVFRSIYILVNYFRQIKK